MAKSNNMDILHILTPYLQPHETLLEKVYLTATTVPAVMMLTASMLALISPTTLSNNLGFPYIRPSYNEKNKAVFGQLLTASHTIHGWIMLFACREFTIAAAMLLLNYLKQYQALSVLVQISYVCGVVDSFAASTYGVKGAYWTHFIPTVLAVWMGPLGLWLYWR